MRLVILWSLADDTEDQHRKGGSGFQHETKLVKKKQNLSFFLLLRTIDVLTARLIGLQGIIDER